MVKFKGSPNVSPGEKRFRTLQWIEAGSVAVRQAGAPAPGGQGTGNTLIPTGRQPTICRLNERGRV